MTPPNTDTFVRFLMHHGHFVEAVLTQEDAHKFSNGWLDGSLQGKIGGSDQKGRGWAVDLTAVIGLIVTPFATLKQLEEEQLREQAEKQGRAQAMAQIVAQRQHEAIVRQSSQLFPQTGPTTPHQSGR